MTDNATHSRIIEDCPFCKGDIDGCCFCDHSGKIYVGEGYVFKTREDMKPFQKEYPKESDLRKLFDNGALNNLHGNHKNNLKNEPR